MVAVVLLDLTEEGRFTYQQPVLAWVRQHYPEVVVLDVDVASEISLVQYAQRLLQEARFCLLFVKADANQTLGAGAALLEQIIRRGEAAAVCLEGTHARIKSLISARPAIAFKEVSSQEEWQPFIASFLEKAFFNE